ncbi:hypothetical protein ALC57_06348, partial [Trachymyrmex cornetzi]
LGTRAVDDTSCFVILLRRLKEGTSHLRLRDIAELQESIAGVSDALLSLHRQPLKSVTRSTDLN